LLLVGVVNKYNNVDLVQWWEDDFQVAGDGTCLNAPLFGVSAYCLQRFEIWQSQISKTRRESQSR
jgi:hypothetical protein